MVSKYDVFYVVAAKGPLKVSEIVKTLNKSEKEYQNIFNNVLLLEKEVLIRRNGQVEVIDNEKAKALLKLIFFCNNNSINYNILFDVNMLDFLEKTSKKEFFTIRTVRIHPQTFKKYVLILLKYGFLVQYSKKPLKCKLLKHKFIMSLLSFFDRNLDFYNSKHKSCVEKIKKELLLFKTNQKNSYSILEEMEKKNEAKFIHLSLNMEGNPLTLPETQKIIDNKIAPAMRSLEHVHEVENYKKALDMMILTANQKKSLDLNLILEYHRTAMAHMHGAGALRKQNVRIKLNPSFKTSDWQLISLKLNKLLDDYNNFDSKDIKKIVEYASFFHNEFQRIHPFIDGNSRTVRLLLLHFLRERNIPIFDIPIGYFDVYMDLTKKSEVRNDKAFALMLQEIILADLTRLNVNSY